ncbi:transcriptional regulator, LacI family [Salinimicrobium catena]|uniref:Transcriptional regulator, LacI family n=1 Tax=Salinimicrobium catena TaxID=390640 RepID=A0A1H5LEF3_9FLAO|nr:LacI family DNA-binding transcriptional regulator [Salinimicrobium catena]SDL08695.1 transcriptional regulator, LacI family [Salinimicrobium catena]SEE74937.1 transcriptional regulator, LacI family [Salinimicrobium catena]
MKPKLTLKQIARELDVSVSTVSKALRDSIEISEETRQKVKAFAKLYNYKPNNIALSLKNRKTRTIGIVLPEIVHDFFATVISGVEQVANEKGYNVIICLSNNSFDREVMNMEMLANGSTDGFILSIAKETQQKKDYHHLEEVINQGMPLVLFDRVVDEIKCDKVIIDDTAGAKKAVQHLIDIGCKRIGIITTVDYISVGKLRTQGYLEALEANGMSPDEDLILKIEDMQGSEKEIAEFLKTRDLDGIFAVNEQFSTSAIRGLLNKGLKVPDDVSVIGFSDGELAHRFIPSLSTINQHGAEIGARAARLLIERLERSVDAEESYQTQIVETSLIERESTRHK